MTHLLTFSISRLPFSVVNRSKGAAYFSPRRFYCSLSPAAPPLSRAHSLAYAAPKSVYVHLPFCAQKCHYCDFTINISSDTALHDAYIDLLIREIRAYNLSTTTTFDTVYLGGGTPSLLSSPQLIHVLSEFQASSDAEITIEMDPGTFDERKAADLFPHVNRVSLGVQSTHDKALQLCGRKHSRRDIFGALEILSKVGYGNISVDLISGLPSVTVAEFTESIDELLRFECVRHFSIYDLTLEKATPFGRKYQPGTSPLPTESDSVRCLNIAQEMLCASSAGFERYEISNYAKKDKDNAYRSRHNMNYWRGSSFYAFGVGATSFTNGTRYARPKTISGYKRFVENGAEIPRADSTDEAVLEDYLINRFRLLIDGLPLGELPDDVARKLRACVDRSTFVADGLLEYIDNGRILRMTAAGAMIENTLLSTLLEDTLWNESGIKKVT